MSLTRLPRISAALGFSAFAALAGCGAHQGGANAPDTTTDGPAEAFRPVRTRADSQALLFLSGSSNQQLVKYGVVDGQAVLEGDILLGPASNLAFRYGLPRAPQRNVHSAVALADRSYLWPDGQIPYVIEASVNAQSRTFIAWTVSHLGETALKLRPKTSSDTDYVVFQSSGEGSGCASYLGRIGGAQEIEIADCGQGSIAHEVLHAAGFYHEQSRGDRDQHVTVVYSEISAGNEVNFAKRDENGRDIGAYDYGSIMHYSGKSFSRTGKPTLIPKIDVKIGQRKGLSDGDRAGIAALYGTGTPTQPSMPTQPTQPTAPTQPTQPTAPSQPAQVASTSFAGTYASSRGTVTCTENSSTVSCQYPNGMMFCTSSGARLDCGWTGGGQGRAAFQRQTTGVLAGTWGDWLSSNSRGAWDLTPSGAVPSQPATPGTPTKPNTPPQPSTPAQPATTSSSLTGNYTSSRGPMTCSESGVSVACTFQENGASGRLDCVKDSSGLKLSCAWLTFLPRLGSGRAVLTRPTPSDRTLVGTWGNFAAEAGGGSWDVRPQ